MEEYRKPTVVDGFMANGIIPAAVAGLVGLSAAKLLVAGAAAGLALGAASGSRDIYSGNSFSYSLQKKSIAAY